MCLGDEEAGGKEASRSRSTFTLSEKEMSCVARSAFFQDAHLAFEHFSRNIFSVFVNTFRAYSRSYMKSIL